VDPGFVPRRLLAARLSLPQSRYGGPDAVASFYDRISARVAELPGVEAVGAASVLPLTGINARTDFTIAGKPPASRTEIPAAQYRWVSSGYFRTMRIEIIEGRDFAATDLSRTQPVVAVDDALAHRYWPGANAVGAHILIDDGVGPARDAEVVAVVRSVKHTALDDAPTPTLYAPMHQLSSNMAAFVATNFNLIVRTRGETASLGEAVRRAVQSLDPTLPLST